MTKRLLIGMLVLGCAVLIGSGCNSDASEGPAETTKVLTDAEFEKSIENAPEAAKVSARAARAQAQAQSGQSSPPKK